jgi:hypothetical protein
MENSLNEQKAILIGRISKIDYFIIKLRLWLNEGNFWYRVFPLLIFIGFFSLIVSKLSADVFEKYVYDDDSKIGVLSLSNPALKIIVSVSILYYLSRCILKWIYDNKKIGEAPIELYYCDGSFKWLNIDNSMSLATIRRYGFSGFTGFSHLIVCVYDNFGSSKYYKLKLSKAISKVDLGNILCDSGTDKLV